MMLAAMSPGSPTVWNLARREVAHRWGSALLTVMVLAAAAATPLAVHGVLRDSDRRAEAAAVAKAEAVTARMRSLEREMRGMTLRMGFNAVILPPGQDLAELHRNGGIPTGSMPEAVGRDLAARKPAAINHLLPALQRRIAWPERGLDIILSGVAGEVFIADPRTQRPLLERVAPGTCVLGRPLAERLGVRLGERVVLRGAELTVAALRPGRGSADDMTLWMELGEAQRLLGEPGVISAVYALLCQCDDDGGALSRRELARLLPGHELLVLATLSKARGEALALAAGAGADVLAAERTAYAAERAARVRLFAWLSAGALLLAAAITAALALEQVRARLGEIAILRAVGWPAPRVLALVLLRATAIGALAGGVAAAAGLAIAAWWAGSASLPADPRAAALCLLGTPLLSLLCALPSALWACRRQPALALGEL